MTICRQHTIVKHYISTAVASPLMCKCWHCEYCAPMRQRDLAKLGMMGRPTTFLTLTVNPSEFRDATERANKLVWAWRTMRRAIIRRFNIDKVPFLAIFETTEAGEPHLHILARLPYVAQRWISRYMHRLIGAPIVDIRRVRSPKGVARYVSKYVSKEPKLWAGCKRYWRSLDWTFGKNAKEEIQGPPPRYFERWPALVDAVVTGYAQLGWGIMFDGAKWQLEDKRPCEPPPPLEWRR